MFDPQDTVDVDRLRTAVNWSEDKLRPFRRNNQDFLSQFVGHHYGESGAADRVPINLIELGVNIFQRQVAAHAPQALVSTPFDELTVGAADLALATNFVLRKIDLETSLNQAGVSALFSIGIVEVGLQDDGDCGGDSGMPHDPGYPFVKPILFEDFILDMGASDYRELSYIGHKFRVPLDWARNNESYDKKLRAKIQCTSRNSSLNGEADERSEALSRGESSLYDEYEEHVELMQIFLPREKLLLVLECDSENPPLRATDWTGPPRGPYHWLEYESVPGNLMPLAPVSLWFDLHVLCNQLFNKVSRQALEQKTVLAVPGQAGADGKRIVAAADGEAIYCDHPDQIKEVKFRGAEQSTFGTILWAKQQLYNVNGNWDALGGLSAQSDTLGQDRLLADASSQRVKDMQQRYLKFAKGVITDVAHYIWNDPILEIPLRKPIRGTDLTIPMTWNSDRQMGDFFDYNFDVDPFSLQQKTPQQRSAALMQFVEVTLPPLMAMMQQEGRTLDLDALFELLAQYGQLPEIKRLLKMSANRQGVDSFGQQDGQQQRAQFQPPDMPANTKRTYERVNRPAGSQQGNDEVLMKMAFGANPQDSEMATLARGNG